jgi:hypothetical protein
MNDIERAISTLKILFRTADEKTVEGFRLRKDIPLAIEALEEKLKPKEKPKSKLLFLLTMPSIGSWNGKWTGEGQIYARARNVKQHTDCKEGNYHYSWGDGWGANIEVKKVTVVEANKYIKKSVGFCGYDWMIDSILLYGQILNSNEIKEYLKQQVSEVEE